MISWSRYKQITRTISQLHSIWLKSNQRSLIRRERFNDFINNLPNLIKPNDKGKTHSDIDKYADVIIKPVIDGNTDPLGHTLNCAMRLTIL